MPNYIHRAVGYLMGKVISLLDYRMHKLKNDLLYFMKYFPVQRVGFHPYQVEIYKKLMKGENHERKL